MLKELAERQFKRIHLARWYARYLLREEVKYAQAVEHADRSLYSKVLIAFMLNIRGKAKKARAEEFNRLRLGVKVFKGLAANSLNGCVAFTPEMTLGDVEPATQVTMFCKQVLADNYVDEDSESLLSADETRIQKHLSCISLGASTVRTEL